MGAHLDHRDLRAAIERAVRHAAAGMMTIDVAVAAVLAATEERKVAVTTKEREKAEGARLLARHDELVGRGHARHNVPMMVAREFGEPHEWETIADRVRRWRATRKKCAPK
jgi:hypothetical protein